jgi:hypothetical protein
VSELHPGTHLHQFLVRCRSDRGQLHPEGGRRPVQQHDITARLRGRGEEEQPSRLGQPQVTIEVALLDEPAHGPAVGEAEASGEPRRVPGAGEFEDGERVAMALRDDLIPDGGVERHREGSLQQGAGVGLAEPPEGQQRQAGEEVVPGRRTHRADERDPFGEEAPGDEGQGLGGGPVEPLGIVDDAGERPLLRGLGDQADHGQADEEPVRRGTFGEPEDDPQRLPLRRRDLVEVFQERRAQLVQAAVRQLHLRLDAQRGNDPPAPDAAGEIGQECTLAHARPAAQQQHARPSAGHVRDDSVEDLALGPPAEQGRVTLPRQSRNRRPHDRHRNVTRESCSGRLRRASGP